MEQFEFTFCIILIYIFAAERGCKDWRAGEPLNLRVHSMNTYPAQFTYVVEGLVQGVYTAGGG